MTAVTMTGGDDDDDEADDDDGADDDDEDQSEEDGDDAEEVPPPPPSRRSGSTALLAPCGSPRPATQCPWPRRRVGRIPPSGAVAASVKPTKAAQPAASSQTSAGGADTTYDFGRWFGSSTK